MKLPGVEGFILAGGLSRRMGRPKALLLVEGERIIARVARELRAVVARLSIVTDRPGEVSFLNLPVVADIVKGCGPLGGLHAALSVSSARTVFLVSCDLPFVSSGLIRSLWSEHGSAPATVPSTSSGVQPLCGFYDRTLLCEVEAHLLSGRRAMRALLGATGARIVPVSSLPVPIADWHLLNVNTPEDLAFVHAVTGGSQELFKPVNVRDREARSWT